MGFAQLTQSLTLREAPEVRMGTRIMATKGPPNVLHRSCRDMA